MHKIPPHRTLMLLHRMVDRALTPLLAPMALEHATEGYLTVARSDLDSLVGAGLGSAGGVGDPQAVLAGFGHRSPASALMICEPSLSSAVLSRIWRSDRNEGAPLTQVEGEILRQFLAHIVEAWAGSWAQEGMKMLPTFNMAGSLSMLRSQLADGRWHIARTIVRRQGSNQPLGVLLFCYPDVLMPQLGNEARSTMWRSRIEHGLGESERQRLHDRLTGPLRHVAITAPVRIRQHMTLGMLNSLERGDVVALDADASGDISFNVLGREVTGRLAAIEDRLAIALTGPGADAAQDAAATSGGGAFDTGFDESGIAASGFGETPPDPDWGLAS